MKFTLRKKLILINLSLLVIVTIAASLITIYSLQRYYKSRIYEQLRIQIEEVKYLLGHSFLSTRDRDSSYNYLTKFAQSANLRLTLIDSLGFVLFDSMVPQDSLGYVENHLHRPEVQMAKRVGIGHDERISATVKQPLLYVADLNSSPIPAVSPFHQVEFIRVAMPLGEVKQALREIRQKIFIGGGIAVILIALVGFWLSQKITNPILQLRKAAEFVRQGNLDARFEHASHDEFGDLADLLNQMLAKLRDDLVQMRKLQTMRSQFLGNVSHELRTPIFALQGYLETLLHQNVAEPEKQKEFLEKAFRISIRLDNLLTDLIDISRIESGEMKMSFRFFNVHDWLKQLCRELKGKAQKNQIELTFAPDLAVQGKISALGDMQRLTQVLTNLANNAIKYNVSGGKVEIGYRGTHEGVEVFVKDTGRGIPEEHVHRIFERFYRVDKERSRAVGGTGLGLAIVKHIVEAHGSEIQVKSEIGKGSEFYFALKTR